MAFSGLESLERGFGERGFGMGMSGFWGIERGFGGDGFMGCGGFGG